MLNILYITYMGLTEPLMESQALAYLKALGKKDNFICILSFEKNSLVAKECIAQIRQDLEGLNIKWFPLKYHKRPLIPAKILDLSAGFIFTFCISLVKKIDVIHARGTIPAFFAFFASRILSRKFVFDVRGLMAKEYADGAMWKENGFYYRVVDILEKMVLRFSDSIVVLTERIKNIIGAKCYTGADISGRISVIPTCVDIEIFKGRNLLSERIKKKIGAANRCVFLYVGSLGTWYMFGEMAEFIKINRVNLNEPFFLVVTQSDTKEAERILRKVGFKDTDYAIVRSEHKEVPYYISSADVGMMFIKPCFSKEASCPTKFGEYLAGGLPVVLNAGIGDCDRIVRDYNVGILVDDFQTNRYLDSGLRLRAMLEDREISNRCRGVAEKEFSLNNAINNYNRIYKSLFNKERRTS